MKRLIVALLLCICTMATAAQIDSTASGVYLGSDRVCRVVLSRQQVSWVQTDITCIKFDGSLSNVREWLYAPNNCPTGSSIPLDPPHNTEYVSLRSYDAQDQTLQIVRGPDQTDVTNGLGTAEAWYVIGYAPSPSPYSCGPLAQAPIDPHALARFCRAYPHVPACL